MNWEEPKKQRWLNARVIAWGLFDLGVTIFSMNIISRYFGPWVIDEQHGTEFAFNVSWSVSIFIAAILQILLSPISDELGRRKIFVICFTMLCITACSLIGTMPTLLMGLTLFVLANIGYQVATVFYFAMLGDVADERHKARISGVGVGLGYVGSITGLLVSQKFVDPIQNNYSSVFGVTALLVLIFSLPLFLFLKERPGLVHFNLAESLRNSIGSFSITLRRVRSHPTMFFFFLGCLLALDGVETVTINMSLYCDKVVGLDKSAGVIIPLMWKGRELFRFTVSEINSFLIVSTFCAVLGAFIIGHIADKTDRYKTLLAVIIVWMLALLLAMFSVQSDYRIRHKLFFWITGPLFGIGFGGIWTVGRAYLLDICHPEERGQMFALFGLVGRGAAILGPLVWAMVFKLSENYLHLGERKTYRLALFAILVLVFLGFLILLRAKPKTEKSFR